MRAVVVAVRPAGHAVAAEVDCSKPSSVRVFADLASWVPADATWIAVPLAEGQDARRIIGGRKLAQLVQPEETP